MYQYDIVKVRNIVYTHTNRYNKMIKKGSLGIYNKGK